MRAAAMIFGAMLVPCQATGVSLRGDGASARSLANAMEIGNAATILATGAQEMVKKVPVEQPSCDGGGGREYYPMDRMNADAAALADVPFRALYDGAKPGESDLTSIAHSSWLSACRPQARAVFMLRGGDTSNDTSSAGVKAQLGSRQQVPGGLWTARGLYFLGYATVGAVAPYLSTFLSSTAGIPLNKLGILGALTPIMTTTSSPLWGAIADRTRKHEEIMLSSHLASVTIRTALVLLITSAAARAHASLVIPVVVGAAAFMMAPVYSIMDDVCFKIAEREGGAGGWARLRMFGSVGFGAGAAITGQLADRSKLGYGVAFLASAALAVPTALLMALLLSGKTRAGAAAAAAAAPAARKERGSGAAAAADSTTTSSRTSSATSTGDNPLAAALGACWSQPPLTRLLWACILVCGASYGFLEVFLFPLLRGAGVPSGVLGAVRGVNAASALPFYFFSAAINRSIGVAGTLAAAALCYAARLLFHAAAAAAAPAPAAVLAVEALYGVTGGAMWSAAAALAQGLAPPGLGATMMGLLNAAHFGVGMSLGSYVGGQLSHRVGSAHAFQVMGAVNAAAAAVVVLALLSHIRKRSEHGDSDGGDVASNEALLLGRMGMKLRRRLLKSTS
ncbi:major facilitator superfamily domain-containing protein [Tribonema minus]|uniref:Major facilitator superfamily domain-containing protein n=1 Tax=Tribonema minus TaxID=303371 RepID=A0A835YLR7_9STRA|nr:major facilitator superfamily domain-containing protein [Tribonema minus]